jgi:hypothetical protein
VPAGRDCVCRSALRCGFAFAGENSFVTPAMKPAMPSMAKVVFVKLIR